MNKIFSLILIDAIFGDSTLGYAFDGHAIFWMALGMMLSTTER